MLILTCSLGPSFRNTTKIKNVFLIQCLGNGLDILLDYSSDYHITGYKGIAGNPYCWQYQSGWWCGGIPSHIGGRFGAAAY